jgi:hypothetical protein
MVPYGSRHHAARVKAYRDWSIVALANHLLLFIVVLLPGGGVARAQAAGTAAGIGSSVVQGISPESPSAPSDASTNAQVAPLTE